MSRTINLLFLGGAKRVSMARLMKDAARQLGLEADIFSYELSKEVPIAVEATVVEGTLWRDPLILDKLWTVVEERHIDIVVPFVDPAISIAARLRDMHQAHDERRIYVPTGPPAQADTMLDKAESARAFESLGIPCPATIPAGTAPTVYPVIAKPRRGSASKGIKVITSADEWARSGISPDDYLVQAYIERREEYTVDCFVDSEGTIAACQPRLRIATAGGEVTDTVTVDTPDLVEASRRALRLLGLRGAVTIQWIRDLATGQLLIMEINPRLGGGAVASVYAGSNLPLMMLNDALTGRAGMVAEPCAGVRMTRYMQEVIFK